MIGHHDVEARNTSLIFRMDRSSYSYSPYCKGSGQWYAKNIIQGFFGSPIEALPEVSVTAVASVFHDLCCKIMF